MPPGPNKANVAVIAAAPAKPVVLIMIRNTSAGTPIPANLSTNSSIKSLDFTFLSFNG